ncbi:DNA recombination protein RmuC [Spiroplasma endosymbiont of Panorpa germanica]|uniref:DNA recombination protein RmuC n=1 Tax=Spiroplasma endosymbiont of Panorpa germanica TaxID=3066314 RepID=UPI0030CB55BA
MSILEIILLVLLLVLIVVLAIIVVKVFKKPSSNLVTDGQLNGDALKLELEKIKNDILTDHLNKTKDVEEKINKLVTHSNSNSNQLLSEVTKHIDSKNEILRQDQNNKASEINNHLINLSKNTANIETINSDVKSISNLLVQNNKAGKAGEYILERIIGNITGSSHHQNILFERQYQLKKKSSQNKGLIIDLMIKGNDSRFVNIPIDSKLPFNEYNKMFNDQGEFIGDSTNNKAFINDVSKHIDKVSEYISIEDNTVYAIMFVPSESIFSFINTNSDLIERAYKKKVIIAGPSTLMAIISSVDKYMTIFDDIKNYDKKLEVLSKVITYFENYDSSINEMYQELEKVLDKMKNNRTKAKSLRGEYQKLLKESGE